MTDAIFNPKEFRLTGLDGISNKTITEHYKLYEGYVKKANEILLKLSSAERESANQIYSDLRSLKLELSFAIGGIRNHEIYFGHLGGDGQPQGSLADLIRQDFGSIENWMRDMKATGLAARGWAWLVYDKVTGKLFNHLGDSQNTYLFWHAEPVIALDTYEHAYWLDYGTRRADYIDAFFRNLDWAVIEESFKKLNL